LHNKLINQRCLAGVLWQMKSPVLQGMPNVSDIANGSRWCFDAFRFTSLTPL